MLPQRSHQHVNVVRHDHKLSQLKFFSIRKRQGILHQGFKAGLGQQAFSVTFIKPLFPTRREKPVIFRLLGQRMRLRIAAELRFTFDAALFDPLGGHRVRCSPSHEIGGPSLATSAANFRHEQNQWVRVDRNR